MAFEITKELLENIALYVENKNNNALIDVFKEMHHADIAEVLEEISFDEVVYIFKLLDSVTTSEILIELDEDIREKIFEQLSAKEIAEEVDELDTDDAADIIGELSEERQEAVMSQIEDEEHVKEIEELLSYHENSAGGLMAKELVSVNENWNVLKCVKEMRIQAEEVTRVHSIYVVNDAGQLKGRLSLKDLLVASTRTHISEIYIPKVDAVHVDEQAEDVANIMRKYDLEAIPVVDNNDVLVGRITIDDIVDVIKEEADKDYQMAAGLTQDVEADDSIFQLIKGRLPWLILGLFGSLGAVVIMQNFQNLMANPEYKALFFFTPLIAAVAGNVGVQSSAIIVQGLANDIIKGSLWHRLIKEVSISLINSIILSIVIIIFSRILGYSFSFSLAISISLITVIIIASLIGTFIPLILHKKGIDPALATGPFITTSNDIFGILIYFMIAKIILGI
ncbi:Magnesium transporter MgtE [Polaribacter huanghezhanensis]|uniref:magnesium transporter n=1 Tax=Polaribacter huanghezhanensis TaxID=1354726 RepID=UPI0026491DD4|nr:magnesium transporter [Polaribacter huanghezhanensis]WKD85338.1 Magnesium transporter MgtE [Polaribacter huanghezhanensis]